MKMPKNYKFKYITVEQDKAIEKLIADGHMDTLTAFGAECMNIYKCHQNRIAAVSVAVGFGLAVAVSIGKEVLKRKKLKESQEVCPVKTDTAE